MALPPQTNEAFLREVDEQVRLDTAARFWKRWGRILIGAVVAALLAFGGYLWWQSNRAASAGVEGEQMSLALDDLAAGSTAKAEGELAKLKDSSVLGYKAAARLALAGAKLAKNDAKGAAADFAAVAADTSLAQPYRDLATVRQVAASFDTMKPEQVVAKLKPLAVSGKPFFGSAGEMTAVAYMNMNKPREAGAMFAALAKDEGVPESIRSRSVQLAGVLGVDVTPAGAKSGNDK
ncbi:tetratricopeptide repeat protein [Sphingomonas sp. SUN039]|uniref:tetratricopeptide repeat protein n=1 Tax=Sphingomonas sp. SUN039 TaxID=2937787 RepID=UPI002164D713|nr:tetratricopeptide repeat protein [Sphingomonas sp. SUN039]UVO54493.1 tetratricopeptide repeat protein [Sphingomonas sp. SUN039]